MDPVTLKLYSDIVRHSELVLNLREEEGFEAANIEWKRLDKNTENMRGEMPPYLFDLIIQLEFLMEDDPMADLSEARRTLYLAKVALQ